LIPTYGSFRKKLTITDFSVNTIAGTTTEATSGDYNFYLQLENRAGRNLLSDPQSITVAEGNGVAVTINESAIALFEDVFWVVISLETTGDPTDATIVAAQKARDDNQIGLRDLPITINLTTDQHFNKTRTVTEFDDLPTSGILNGAIALVADTGIYYRYDTEAFNSPEGYRSYGTIVEGKNKWIRYFGTHFSYLGNTQTGQGSDRSLNSIPYALTLPPKIGNGDSTPLTVWLNNGFEGDGQSPIVNGRYTLELKIAGIDYQNVFAEKVKYKLRGYVDKNTWQLNTAIASYNEVKVWSPTEPIKLPEDLPRNHAAVYDLILSFDNSEVSGLIPEIPSPIGINLITVNNNQGKLSNVANIIGDLVLGDKNKLLIVPGDKRLSGVATIKIPGSIGYEIDTDIEQPLVGLLPNTDGQIAAIAGSLNGFVTIRQSGEPLAYSEKIRAYISTLSGLSSLSVASSTVTVNNSEIKITVEHPVNNLGKGIIRADYPDPWLRGIELGEFTPYAGYIFLNLNGTFYQSQELTVAAVVSQEFTFDNLSTFTQIPSLPVQNNSAFSLFESNAIAISSTGLGTITGTIIAYFAYSYNANNYKATSIRHDLPNAIPTATKTFGEIASQLSQLADHLINYNNPHQISPAQIGAATQVDFDAAELVIDNLKAIIKPAAIAVNSLPLTLTPSHHTQNIILSGLTGEVIIPNNVSSFPDKFQVLISQKDPGAVLIKRQTENTDLFFSSKKRYLRSTGEVVIRRIDSTNVFFISGNLED
jgi:hypothetical protein